MESEILKHKLIPKHIKISEEEGNELLKKFNVEKKQLPVILKNDPAISHLELKKGDIIKIERESPTIGKAYFYRIVK
ncbi:DNA-directed RNA polymerase subunit H [Candidatus Woesearchaeota archaeon]|nr:DNA-directed RNA polymerase subunit H [Candidatus Woesearchaeota archaeon]